MIPSLDIQGLFIKAEEQRKLLVGARLSISSLEVALLFLGCSLFWAEGMPLIAQARSRSP